MPVPVADSIARDDLTYVVEGVLEIVRCHFAADELERIRQVAVTTDRIAYGNWKVDGVGCPITQARISRSSDGELFAEHYDQVLRGLLDDLHYDVPDEGVLTILG